MPNGLLGKGTSVANTDLVVYTAPSGCQYSTVNLLIVNTNGEIASIKVGITLAETPGIADYIEYNAQIPANGGILERTCLILSPNEKIIVNSTVANVTVRVNGLEAN